MKRNAYIHNSLKRWQNILFNGWQRNRNSLIKMSKRKRKKQERKKRKLKECESKSRHTEGIYGEIRFLPCDEGEV